MAGSTSSKHEKQLVRQTSKEVLLNHGFRIGETIGEGSYCKVKTATYKGQDIAVKIIQRAKISNDFNNRFLPREVRTLATVQHKSIIEIYKIFDFPKTVYIFMEMIKRGDLLSLIRERRRLHEHESRHYFKQLVSALKYLHSLNIAHRDIKCENIMINEEDEIKLIDFGFCRSTVNKKGRRVLSETFCGSTAYAPPEVLQGQAYNPMMYDVWSLGCVLYIMTTGTMPFDDSNVARMVRSQEKRDIKYPTNLRLTSMVKKLIGRMLEPDVTRRATMDQVSRHEWATAGENFYRYYSKDLFRSNAESTRDADDTEATIDMSQPNQKLVTYRGSSEEFVPNEFGGHSGKK